MPELQAPSEDQLQGLISDGLQGLGADETVTSASLWKINSSGVLQWTKDASPVLWGIAFVGSNIVVCGEKGRSEDLTSVSVWCYDSSGTELWYYDTGDAAHDVATDGTDVWVCGMRSSGWEGSTGEEDVKSVWKLNGSTGALIWSGVAFGTAEVDTRKLGPSGSYREFDQDAIEIRVDPSNGNSYVCAAISNERIYNDTGSFIVEENKKDAIPFYFENSDNTIDSLAGDIGYMYAFENDGTEMFQLTGANNDDNPTYHTDIDAMYVSSGIDLLDRASYTETFFGDEVWQVTSGWHRFDTNGDNTSLIQDFTGRDMVVSGSDIYATWVGGSIRKATVPVGTDSYSNSIDWEYETNTNSGSHPMYGIDFDGTNVVAVGQRSADWEDAANETDFATVWELSSAGSHNWDYDCGDTTWRVQYYDTGKVLVHCNRNSDWADAADSDDYATVILIDFGGTPSADWAFDTNTSEIKDMVHNDSDVYVVGERVVQ